MSNPAGRIVLSIFLPSNRPANILGFARNLEATAADKTSFELLLKVDEGDQASIDAAQAAKREVRFSLKVLVGPRLEGYYSLHHAYESLRGLMDPQAYFCLGVSDELRIATLGWDQKIAAYEGHFPDHIFRLKTSLNRRRNYYYLLEALGYPDNYFILTRRWLDIAGGWGEIWGPDTWHGAIEYYMGYCRCPYETYNLGIFRSVAIDDIEWENEEAGMGISKETATRKKRMAKQIYGRLLSLPYRRKFLKIAQTLTLHIWIEHLKRERPGTTYTISDDTAGCRLLLREADGTLAATASYDALMLHAKKWWKHIARPFLERFIVGF